MTPPLEKLGKYRITEVLGEGAMGIVYKGFDPDIRRDVAIKTMRSAGHAEAGAGVSHADRFRNEAQAAGRLQHPGIVAVYDYGHDAGVDFIAMEYVRGHTLSRYLSQASAGKLDIDDNDVQSIVGQLLEALHHAHEQGVWHRDVKPSNLIITPAGKVKVSDFGIARIESVELTQVASAIGTPLYMAPEQFQGHAIDRRVDLYATGVVLYQMLCGKPPFTGSAEAMMYKAVHEAPVPPSCQPGLQRLAPYDAVLARALAKDPAQRYAHALQFRDALGAAIGQLHPDAVSNATITALLPQRPAGGAAGGGTGVAGGQAGAATGSSVSSRFGAAELAQAEASLVRLVGPMASVMVKRAARECHDLPALYARLAEQVTDPAARQAFASQAAALTGTNTGLGAGVGGRSATGTGRGAPPGTGPVAATNTGPAATNTGAGSGPPSAAMLEAAQRLLAQHLGPIAKVVVRKACADAPQRDVFISRLVAVVDDPAARQRLQDGLKRLPP